MNIVLITTGGRPELLQQTVVSLITNATSWKSHSLTAVLDSWPSPPVPEDVIEDYAVTFIKTRGIGASAARNTGAASIPKYRRQDQLMFVDDDVYMLPGWDSKVEAVLEAAPSVKSTRGLVVSGHAHPFNHPIGHYTFNEIPMDATNVLSTVHLAMPWWLWDVVGYFVEPGGPGGSEDVEWCGRATRKGYGLAITDPMCVVHCGLTSSRGQQIVGYEQMMEMNTKLVADYGLTGKVQFS